MHAGEKKRCTIADIAREAGVSKTSVSFAFNSPHRIGDETRKHILEVARRLKYVPDPSARNFSLGRTQTLGFLLPQAVDTCLANPYIVEVMKGLGQVCQEHGYMLTLIPPLNDSVYEAVKKFIGKDPYKGINPDECVAIGAAIQAGVLAGEVKDMLLLDVTPLSLGIETLGGGFTKLIDRNTTIPTSKSQIFSTAADHQTSVDIHVLQGERKFARDNKTLGRFELTGIAPAPRGVPQIEVTFDIDANGIVSVKAVDKGTNKSQSITITASSNLSESDIDAAIKDAEKYAEEDEKRKNLVEAKNNAEQFIFVIEKFETDNSDKIADADKDALKDAIKEAREGLESAATDEDVKAVVQKLSKVTDPIFTKFYQENPEAAAEAAKQAGFDPNAANNGGGFGGDGVVNDDNMTPPEGGWED